LMIFNMQNYVALGNVGIVPIVSPANNSVDVDTLLNILGTKDTNAVWYDYKITSDFAGSVIVLSRNGVDRPRISVDLEPGKTYYIFERANGTNTGQWSTPNKITTKVLPIILPGKALINSPLDNATKVGIPVPYDIIASNATSYRILVAKDLGLTQIVKDTIVFVTNPNIPLQNGMLFYTEVIGLNSNGAGQPSDIKSFSTTKATPTLISMLFPLNNAVEVVQPTNVKSSTGGASAEGYKFEIQTKEGVAVFDTATIANEFYKKLDGNREFRIRGWAVNSDVEGPKSAWVYFKTFNDAPGSWSITGLINNAVVSYVNKKLAISSTPATDVNNDIVTKNFHVVGPSLDTIIHANNIETIYLDSARLKLDSQYTISGEATDGSKVTPANTVITFKTPKPTTGIEDIFRQGDFLIYPNPANQDITIEYYLLQNLEINICLYSHDGKKLICQSYDKSTGSQIHRMNLSSVEKGIFIIKLMTRDSGKERLIKTFKLIRN
jgi:hypothetical protein